MSYKKMLVIILIVILTMFGLMLTTSYAWYSFEAGSTTFDAFTSNDDVEITFLKGEYINNTVAVPIKNEDVDRYSDKHPFTIRVKDDVEDNEILVNISLVDISMSSALRTDAFRVDLYYQGELIKTVKGYDEYEGTIITGSDTTREITQVTLDNDIDNNFEVRVYVLDDDTDQSGLMDKYFNAKIQVDVVSRLKTSITTWDDPDIYVSSVTIDGETSNYLPTDGYYTMEATCEKGSNLTWDGFTKTITYEKGSYINDSCALAFTSGTSTMYLNQVEPGSYVEYIGTNGCDGRHCEGDNANYESDLKMGYCNDDDYQFTVNGWRVAYIKDGSAYLISAGAPECVATYIDSKSDSIDNSQSFGSEYYYGSDYEFDSATGNFTISGETRLITWSDETWEDIVANTQYTCRKSSLTDTCTTLYELTSYYSNVKGYYYEHVNYETTSGLPLHMAHLNQVAQKYCNKEYAKNGVCDETTAWAMKDNDFQNIMEKTLLSCVNEYSDKTCGYANDLIDNGGYYWYAHPYSTSSNKGLYWFSKLRYICNRDGSYRVYGVRPVLYLESSVLVVGGSGTYEDPYQISN